MLPARENASDGLRNSVSAQRFDRPLPQTRGSSRSPHRYLHSRCRPWHYEPIGNSRAPQITKPLPRQLLMKRGQDIFEYACHEGNYGMFNLLSGARAADATSGQ